MTSSVRVQGQCRISFAFEAGTEIDINRADERLARPTERALLHHRRGRRGDGTGLTPLLIRLMSEPVAVTKEFVTEETLEASFYQIGTVCVTFRINIDAALEDLVALSCALYANKQLQDLARAHAEHLVEAAGDAVKKPRVPQTVEDYVVYRLEPFVGVQQLTAAHRNTLARILRAEAETLSEDEVRDALAHSLGYHSDEICFIDWFASVLIGESLDDETRVLEWVTAELVALRHLDKSLEQTINQAYDALGARRRRLWGFSSRGTELSDIARLQADHAILFEGLDNALKLFGDDYLARFYRRASERFHVRGWDASIQRKLGTLNDIYGKVSDLAAQNRSEVLEWIIILLIAVEIILFFTPWH